VARDFVDCDSLQELGSVFARCPADARNAVRKVNRAFAGQLRDHIRGVAPRTGGIVQHRNPDSRNRGMSRKRTSGHDTRAGSWKASVKSFARVDNAGVRGGGARAPHFIVNEFGGAVWWHKTGRKSAGHSIPVRERSPMNVVRRYFNGERKFPEGWYFWKTSAEHMPEVVEAHDAAMRHLVETQFGKL